MVAAQVDGSNRAGIGAALSHRPAHLVLGPSKSLARQQPSPPPSAPPLPTLPASKAKQRTSARRSLEMSAFPLPLTAHNSLASFKAAHAPVASSSQGGCSSETHRTSSNVDLDFSYEAEFPPPPQAAELKEQFYHAGPSSSWQVEPRGVADWVGIDMIPSSHDIPEIQLVRSSSGQLVDAKHSRASSAMDLREQFRAAEIAATQAQLTSRAEAEEDEQGDAELARRRANVREGKRPVEGERAFLDTAPLASTSRFEVATHSQIHNYDDDDDHRDGHVVLVPEMSPPRSAPPQFSASFASQQEQARARRMSIEARANKVYPLPLQLLQRNKYAEDAEVYLRLGRRHGDVAPSESDFDSTSYGPSPLFESDWEGTARTAPSTPNDTPILKGSSDGDEDAKPVPHRLGASPVGAGSAIGLGFDFNDSQPGPSTVSHEEGRDHFPLIPLRANRRLSLSPAPPPKDTTHRLIPSVSISPPPPGAVIPEEDMPHGTSSSTLAQDSLVDATISPTGGVSRRLSAVKTLPKSTSAGEEAGMSDLQEFVTPPSRPNSPNVRTPQHLLVTPTQNRFLNIRSPSFSFNPEPLRLVKVQLMRAAGYGLSPPQADAPTTEEMAHTAVAVHDGVKADTTTRASIWDSFIDFVTSSPVARLDEVVPAKLILFVGSTRAQRPSHRQDMLTSSTSLQAGLFLGPWCWLIGGWYLRSPDGEFRSTRGRRCREPDCGCGRIMRGSALRDHPAAVAAKNDRTVRVGEERFAGLDKWVFYNRVAAGSSGAIVTGLVIVAIWAAITA